VQHRAALITGASSGIGEAFARVLPETTSLLLTGRRADRLAALAAELTRPGRRVETVAADLGTEAGCAAVIERARGFGIELLVCNAGIGFQGTVGKIPRASERATVAVNVAATVDLVAALLPEMLQAARSGGRRAGIIIVSSTAAYGAMPEVATYAASKAFGLHFAESLAAELAGAPADVLALLPGYTATEFFARAGMAAPAKADSPEQVAREALQALGRRRVHFVGTRWPDLKLFLARNPVLKIWRLPRLLRRR
jgi:hypothetical protein